MLGLILYPFLMWLGSLINDIMPTSLSFFPAADWVFLCNWIETLFKIVLNILKYIMDVPTAIHCVDFIIIWWFAMIGFRFTMWLIRTIRGRA